MVAIIFDGFLPETMISYISQKSVTAGKKQKKGEKSLKFWRIAAFSYKRLTQEKQWNEEK